MRRLGFGFGVALLVAAAAQGQQVDLVSRAGTPADSAGRSILPQSYRWSVSDDGRYAVYLSAAPNVVAGQVDVNTGHDAFLFDRVSGTTTLVSRTADSSVTTGLTAVSDAVISANGAVVAFTSSELFLYERASGELRSFGYGTGPSLSADGRFLAYHAAGKALVYDRATDTTEDLGYGYYPRISADGRFVAYQDYYSPYSIFLFDRTAGTSVLVDHAAGAPTTPANGPSSGFDLSGDGAFVVFSSSSTDLVGGQVDTPDTYDAFLFERATGDVRLVTHAPASTVEAVGQYVYSRMISRDGRFVVFESAASDQVPGQIDTNGNWDVFLYDRATTQVSLVSHVAGAPTTAGDAGSFYATLSADGGQVAFVSGSTNLMAGQVDPTPGPYYTEYQAFVYERATDTSRLATHVVGQPAVGSAGVGNGTCAVAGGGGFAVYSSPARDLTSTVPANVEDDVFLYERATGLNHLVSRSGRPPATANAPSAVRPTYTDRSLKTSADGRYVVFTSAATNLVPGQVDRNGVADVFLFDRGAGQTTLVSRAAGSATTTTNSTSAASFATISPDGSLVVFLSGGTNLVPGQIDATGDDFFLFERATGEVSLVNHPPGQEETTAGTTAAAAAISDDGRFVVLALAGDLGGGYGTLHVLDRQDGVLAPLPPSPDSGSWYGADVDAKGDFFALLSSVYPTGNIHLLERATGAFTLAGSGASYPPVISGDGRIVAFLSIAEDLVPGQVDTPNSYDAFLFDRVAGTTTLASHALASPATAAGADGYGVLGMSRDGRYVAFESTSTGLVAGQDDATGTPDVFLFDRETGIVTLVSHAVGLPATAAGGSYQPAISADGSVVAFVSYATNLVSSQSGPAGWNVFLYERSSGIVTLASRSLTGASGNAASQEPVLSRSGSHVFFASDASDLVAEDFNQKTDVFVFGACSAPPVITIQPSDQAVGIGKQATFQVLALNAGGYQWQKEGLDIPGATGVYYTTPPLTAADSGTTYGVVVRGACGATTPSVRATVTIADSSPPTANVLSPDGGEYWLLSPAGGPPRPEIVSWTMADDVRVCQVTVSLHYSSDGGVTYVPAPAGGGLPATFGSGGSCPYPGVTTTNLEYTVPTTFPSGSSGSLYKVRVVVTDQAANPKTAWSENPFYIVRANPDTVRTLILANVPRMQARQGLTPGEATALNGKLLELASHPRVQGAVFDLGAVTALSPLYAALDAAVAADDGTSPARANDVLFAPSGVHDYLRSLLAVYSGARYLVLVGDDRIIPFARLPDRTVLLPESAYPGFGELRGGATGVGQALAASTYLSDDPLAVRDEVRPTNLASDVFVPDLETGRLVETAPEITTTIATFIGQSGIFDLSALDAATGHKALVTGYDFLTDGAKRVRKRWKAVFGVTTPDASLAPVDGSLVGGNWGLGSASARTAALRTRLAGNGGAPYGVVSLSGHAAHYLEGVPGNDFTDIQGLFTSDVYGTDACATPSLGALNLSGTVVYAAGCHGGLPVPGSCRTDADHSLDLPQTFLARGVQGYVANTGYGWGLKHGVGYGERLAELMTEELSSAGTVTVGEAVRRAKQRYFLEAARFDPYDQKTLMQWTVYGLPMYAVRTGIGPAGPAGAAGPTGAADPNGAAISANVGRGPGVDRGGPDAAFDDAAGRPLIGSPGKVGVRREVLLAQPPGLLPVPSPGLLAAQPPYLTQVNLSFDFTADGLYQKWSSTGDAVAGTGCADPDGCYYTLNGLATGSTDLPVQPYFVYDSRLSGTSQHGVLWKGGTYDEEAGWRPVFSELISTLGGADGSNHGDAPRLIVIRATAPRLVPGQDPAGCRPSDLEVNSVVTPAGEALKAQDADPTYTVERRYRTVDLEAFYFSSATNPGQNCDRDGPEIQAGPFGGSYHEVSGRTVRWSVPAKDHLSDVWRVVIVSNDNTVDGTGKGRWVPVDLTFNPAAGRWEGTRSDLSGNSTRLTYVVQAVDTRGNVTWIDYVSATLPSSGVPLQVARAVDVAVPPGTTVTGFAPASAPVGATVTVTGTNLVGVTLVTFGGVPASFGSVSSSQLSAVVPPGAVTGPIEVTAALGRGTSPTAFVVQAPPNLVSLAPSAGPIGTLVRVSGTNLSETTGVDFNGRPAVFAVLSPTTIEAAVPPGATTGPVTVTTLYGTAPSPTSFTVTTFTDGSLSVDDVFVGETTGGTATATFSVTLSNPLSEAVTVSYATAAGTATSPADYAAVSGLLTFAPGVVTQTVPVTVQGDSAVELDETFALVLSAPSGATVQDAQGLATILDDDAVSRELSPGSAETQSLAALPGPVADTDDYVLAQAPYSSYEVVVDALSADLRPLELVRLAADYAAVLQSSAPVGTGTARSLRWQNPTPATVVNQVVRVRSGGCTTTCGPDDTYRIRVRETTASIPRFNNAGSQVTVLLLHNTGGEPLAGTLHFWSPAGALLHAQAFAVPARGSFSFGTAGIAALQGKSGAVTVSHDGAHGQLAGKSVALEAATGFSFDSPLEVRP